MNRTGRTWYTGVVLLITLGVIGALIVMCAPSASALDTDRHGRYYAYAKTVKTLNPDGSTCATYWPMRKNTRTGKVLNAATYRSGRKIIVDRSICGPHSDSYGKAPAGFRVIDLSPSGRYLTFYALPTLPIGTLQAHDIALQVYRKDFKTGRLQVMPPVMETALYYTPTL